LRPDPQRRNPPALGIFQHRYQLLKFLGRLEQTQIRIKRTNTGFLVPVGDYRALAERIAALMDDDKLCRLMAERARLSARAFHINQTVKQTEAYYRKILYDHTP